MRLFTLLHALSKKEWQQLDQFLRSGLEKLLPMELRAWEEISHPILSKSRPGQKDWTSVSNRVNALERRMRSVMLAHTLKYVQYAAFQNDKALQELLQAQWLNQRELDDLFTRTTQHAKSAKFKRKPEDWHHAMLFQEEDMRFHTRQGERVPSPTLQKTLVMLDEYFMLKKLKFTCASINQENIVASSPGDPDGIESLRVVTNYLEDLEKKQKQLGLSPLTWMYYYAYQTLCSQNALDIKESYLKKLLTKLQENHNNIDQEELLDLYMYGLNYSIGRLNRDGSEPHKIIIREIYEGLLESGVLLSNSGLLSPLHFKNIARAMVSLKAYAWAKKFINEYGDRLEMDIHGVGKQYGMGLQHFYQGEFSQANLLFDQVIGQSNDVFFGLDSRVFLLKIIFERRADEPDWFQNLESAARAFRGALSRRKRNLSVQHQENYLEFINYVIRLGRKVVNPPGSPRNASLKGLIAELETVGNIADTDWLKDKLKVLNSKGRDI
ncbi:MAG TPA: hypothetical protein ENJ82_14680 [Bacteroidetes bacterium]|nr:hypothetical protein [Bacteroidota bacterium]